MPTKPKTFMEAAWAIRNFIVEHFPEHSDGHKECDEACRLVREFDESLKIQPLWQCQDCGETFNTETTSHPQHTNECDPETGKCPTYCPTECGPVVQIAGANDANEA